MVPGIGNLSLDDCPCYPEPEALFQKQTREISAYCNAIDCSSNLDPALHPPLGTVFGFTPLSLTTYLLILMIVSTYIVAAEITKTIFYRKVKF